MRMRKVFHQYNDDQFIRVVNKLINKLLKSQRESFMTQIIQHVFPEWKMIDCFNFDTDSYDRAMIRIVQLETERDFLFDQLTDAIYSHILRPDELPNSEKLWGVG